jgi:Bacteriophage baseplate protein W
MNDDFLGIGWAFPLQVDTGGRIKLSSYEEDIKEAIWIILSTSKGERVMHPEFGCGIHDYVFSVVDTSTLTLVEISIKEALTLWEPRIRLTEVKASTGDIDQGKLSVAIEYEVKSTNNRFNLVYPFYLKEG